MVDSIKKFSYIYICTTHYTSPFINRRGALQQKISTHTHCTTVLYIYRMTIYIYYKIIM